MGGKKKSARKPPKKVVKRLPKTFKCPFCDHEGSVEVKLDKLRKIATLQCRVCSVDYTTWIHPLSEPVDVYHEWIDKADELNKAARAADSGAPHRDKRRHVAEIDDDEDDVGVGPTLADSDEDSDAD